jgi:hypothetical protein
MRGVTRDSGFEARPYADLPDEVLEQVLSRTAEVAEGVRSLFMRVDERREMLRATLLLNSHVRNVDELPDVPAPTCAAVDGGAAVEKALGADTALAIAVGIEGLTDSPTPHWPGVQYAAWQKTLPHQGEETATTCRGVMTALELAVLRDAPHEVVFLDGSHFTPVIALNTMLGVRHEELRSEIAATVTERRRSGRSWQSRRSSPSSSTTGRATSPIPGCRPMCAGRVSASTTARR